MGTPTAGIVALGLGDVDVDDDSCVCRTDARGNFISRVPLA